MIPVRVAALLFLTGVPLGAQERAPSPDLREGTRVRVTAPHVLASRSIGTVQTPDSSGFRLSGYRPGAATWVPYSAVQTLEVSEGKHRGSFALAGFVLGPVVGAALGAGMCSMGSGDDPCFAPIGFGLTGLIAGPVMGAILAPDRWRRLQ